MKRLILPLTFVFAISCASLPTRPIQVIGQIPDVVERFDGDVQQAINKALDVLEVAVTKEEQAANAYLAVRALVPANIDTQVRRAFTNVSDLIIYAVEKLKQGVKTWAEFRVLLQPIVLATNYLTRVSAEAQPGNAPAASPFKAFLSDLVSQVANAAVQRVIR